MLIDANKNYRILLLSGYDAASHRSWRNILIEGLKGFDWTEISLPDRYFSWRIRGNALSFAFQHKEVLTWHYDCIIITSMVDLANLRGFIPQLAKTPCILYFHENQFEYPTTGNSEENLSNVINAQLTSIYATLCADKILFNSNYNKQTFFTGAQKLLNRLPDEIPKNLLYGMQEKAQVLAVPISDGLCAINNNICNDKSVDTQSVSNDADIGKPLEIVWNHRWEYDKQPEVFFDAMILLKQHGFQFRLHVLGQSFRRKPDCFKKAQQSLNDVIQTWGFQSKRDYHRILAGADIAISTALHDFQGLSLLEAIASGCIPVAPNRVAYPEYIQKHNLYRVGDGIDEAQSLYKKMVIICEQIQNIGWLETTLALQKQSIKQYLDSHLLIKYQQTIIATIKDFNRSKT